MTGITLLCHICRLALSRVTPFARPGPQIIAPFVASMVVIATGYTALFLGGGVLSILGALSILPIRSVR